MFELDDIDLSKVPAGLSLIKDQGIYLISNGIPRLKASPDSGNRNFVVYAETYGPDADYDRVAAAAGGDDFCEFLPLEMFQTAVAQAKNEGKTYFVVHLTSKHIRILV